MRTVRILTVGNSFADNALTYLEEIAEGTEDVRIISGRANLGGCSLEKHANLARYSASHPDFRPYNLYSKKSESPAMVSLQEALKSEAWDFVTLQQVSKNSPYGETFEPWLGELVGIAGEMAPQAKLMLHQTWAYRKDSPYFPEQGLTPETMHRRIRENYRQYAAEYHCGILPSGEALYRARNVSGRGYTWPDPDFDYRNAAAPALPRQENSFAVGWHWQITNTPDGVPKLVLDPNHLGDRGCFLCGAVWFGKLTGKAARDSRFRPEGITEEDHGFLCEIAEASLFPEAATDMQVY